MTHKILVESIIGSLEWTPPQAIQKKFDKVSHADQDKMKQFMSDMIEGYVCALIDSQRTPIGLAWLKTQTTQLVKDAILIAASESSVPPSKMN